MSKPYPASPSEVLRFAEHVARKVRTNRKERLRVGKITDEEAARDIACAEALARLARERVLVTAPMN